jgi:hypothetical protein
VKLDALSGSEGALSTSGCCPNKIFKKGIIAGILTTEKKTINILLRIFPKT